MAIRISWGRCDVGDTPAVTDCYFLTPEIQSNGTATIDGGIYKDVGSKNASNTYVVVKLGITPLSSLSETIYFISPGINVKGLWHSDNKNAFFYPFKLSNVPCGEEYSVSYTFYWSSNQYVSSTSGLNEVISPKYTSFTVPHVRGTISISNQVLKNSSDRRHPSAFTFTASLSPAPSGQLTFSFINNGDGPDIGNLIPFNSSSLYHIISLDKSHYGKNFQYSVSAKYDDGTNFDTGGIMPIAGAYIPYPTGYGYLDLLYDKSSNKITVKASTNSELYNRTGKVNWNNKNCFDGEIKAGEDITSITKLFEESQDAPSEDGTYSASMEVKNPDDTTYGSSTKYITLSSALSNDSTFRIEVSPTNKLTIYFETGRSLTENKTAIITATYSNKNQDYSTYSSFKKQDTLDLSSGSYQFQKVLDLGEDAPNGIYLITVSTGSTDTISKEITIIKKKEETDLTCTVEESARNPHRFYLTFENFVPGVKYDRTVKISLTKKSTATKFIDNQILLTKSTNTVTIPASDVARTTIANQYIAWDKTNNIYDDVLTATINVYGTIDGKEVLLRSFTDLKTIYPAWSPIQEFSWPEGQEVAVGKKFNITAETWNNLQLKVISSIENIIDDLDSSSIIDVQSGQTFTKDIYNNLISFLNLAEVKSYISATTDLPTAESITKYLNENHLFVYNTPMDLPIYDISKYGKALPQTVVITAKKLNDIVDRVNAIIRKLNSTSTTS